MLLDEAVAKADSAPYPAKDLSLDSPFQKVGRVRREVASLTEAAVSNFLQQYEPPPLRSPKPNLRRKSRSCYLVNGQTKIRRELTVERLKGHPVSRQ